MGDTPKCRRTYLPKNDMFGKPSSKADTLERFVKMAPKSFNSSQRIFKTFIDLLIGSYPKDRRISYYK